MYVDFIVHQRADSRDIVLTSRRYV